MEKSIGLFSIKENAAIHFTEKYIYIKKQNTTIKQGLINNHLQNREQIKQVIRAGLCCLLALCF